MFLFHPCCSCYRRESAHDGRCAICIFLSSPEEQKVIEYYCRRYFEKYPEAIFFDRRDQIQIVMRRLPYVERWRKQYIFELHDAVRDMLNKVVEEINLEVEAA